MKLIDVLSSPWAIQPDTLLEIRSIAERHTAGGKADIEALETKLGRPLQNTRAVTMRGDIALIPVTGPVFRYANLFTDVSGATSLAVLASDFAAADSNPAVSQIVLVIDSPGGQANGIAEFAQLINAASKPVTAYIDNTAASAAYWIAAAADTIVMAKTAMVGSIGAVVTISPSRADGTVEIISSQSPNKRADVNTDAGRAQIQTLIDGLAQVFVEDIAAYRNVSVDTVLAKFGGGGMKLATEAVALGMADKVGTLETLLSDLSKTASPSSFGVSKMQNATNTNTTNTTVLAIIAALTIESLRADNPALFAAVLAEGAKTERDRIASIEAQALPGHEALLASLKADGKSTGGDAAMQILAAERAKLASMAASLRAEAPAPVPHALTPSHEASSAEHDQPLEVRCRNQWEQSAALRQEFSTLETYISFERAQAAGHAKIFRQ